VKRSRRTIGPKAGILQSIAPGFRLQKIPPKGVHGSIPTRTDMIYSKLFRAIFSNELIEEDLSGRIPIWCVCVTAKICKEGCIDVRHEESESERYADRGYRLVVVGSKERGVVRFRSLEFVRGKIVQKGTRCRWFSNSKKVQKIGEGPP
jgi:hypothetical protein